MRLTGPSNVQSKTMLVVSQRKRGLSSRLNSAAAFSPASVNSDPPYSRGPAGGPPRRAPPPALAGRSPGLYWPTVVSGTRPPPVPRGSAITTCSGAHSPVILGSPLGRRGGRVAFGVTRGPRTSFSPVGAFTYWPY